MIVSGTSGIAFSARCDRSEDAGLFESADDGVNGNGESCFEIENSEVDAVVVDAGDFDSVGASVDFVLNRNP